MSPAGIFLAVIAVLAVLGTVAWATFFKCFGVVFVIRLVLAVLTDSLKKGRR